VTGTNVGRTRASHSARRPVWNTAARQVNGTGSIRTRDGFGDCQLHVEFQCADDGKAGNSGVYMMGRYELQVFNSYKNATKVYPDGQNGGLYGQWPPLVNASKPAGEGQAYDIIFHRPRFDDAGNVSEPARFTVLHNGVLIHDHAALTGPTAHKKRPPYSKHADKAPILLQDHGNPVRYRNIWVRELE